MESEIKRISIIEAAEEIISQKGFAETKISDIATKAGIADAVIYQYFGGKEDLLFAIPQIRLNEVLQQLNEQLEGITDAESLLSKMIYFQLKFNDRHPGYTRILLFECRSSQDFYKSEAYLSIKEYSKILMNILKKGISDGCFRSDIDLQLVRDIIFGLLDFEAISCLAINEMPESIIDHNDIMKMLFSMIRKPNYGKVKSKTSKHDRILDAAEKIFAENSFLKAKITDIAKLANVSDGTIYEYFENKEELLFTIPMKHFKYFSGKLLDSFEITESDRKIRRLVNYTFSFFLREPIFSKVFILQIQLNQKFYTSKAYGYYNNYIKFIEDIINKGKNDGTFRKDLEPRVIRNMFLGAFNHIMLRWLILGDKTDKIYEVDNFTSLISLAILPEKD